MEGKITPGQNRYKAVSPILPKSSRKESRNNKANTNECNEKKVREIEKFDF